MLKLNASYAKKVPAGGEYSSQSYHAAVEVELPDGLAPEELQERIHETFVLVRNAVEAELHQKSPENHEAKSPDSAPQPPALTSYSGGGKTAGPASPKQLSYLLDLARGRGVTPQQIAIRFQVPKVEHLSRQQCSELIREWRAA